MRRIASLLFNAATVQLLEVSYPFFETQHHSQQDHNGEWSPGAASTWERNIFNEPLFDGKLHVQ